MFNPATDFQFYHLLWRWIQWSPLPVGGWWAKTIWQLRSRWRMMRLEGTSRLHRTRTSLHICIWVSHLHVRAACGRYKRITSHKNISPSLHLSFSSPCVGRVWQVHADYIAQEHFSISAICKLRWRHNGLHYADHVDYIAQEHLSISAFEFLISICGPHVAGTSGLHSICEGVVLGCTYDTLASPSNLKRWGLLYTNDCYLCGVDPCTISHILSGCNVAVGQVRHKYRHDPETKNA